jgi:HEAT repeat protein
MFRKKILVISLFALTTVCVCGAVYSQVPTIQTSDHLLSTAKSKLQSDRARKLALRTLILRAQSGEAEALETLRSPEAFSVLSKISVDKKEDNDLRYDAVRNLAATGNNDAVPILTNILMDSNEDRHLRVVTALSLGEFGGIDSIHALGKVYDTTDDKNFRHTILRALYKTNDSRALEYGIRGLEDPDRFVRAEAVSIIGRLGDNSHVELLRETAERGLSESRLVTGSCFFALACIGTSEAEEALMEFANHPEVLKSEVTTRKLSEALNRLKNKSEIKNCKPWDDE